MLSRQVTQQTATPLRQPLVPVGGALPLARCAAVQVGNESPPLAGRVDVPKELIIVP